MTPKTRWLIPLLLVASLGVGGCSTATHTATLTRSLGGSARGALSGQLIVEGGPPQGGKPRPISGVVTFLHQGSVTAKVEVGADGEFSQALPPGSYQVKVCTSHIQQVSSNGSPVDACQTPVPAIVHAGQTATVPIPYFAVP
jgi:hypothetical protein